MSAMINKIWQWIMKAVEVIVVLSLVAISLVLLYQVIMRFLFNNPPKWTEELSMSLVIWVCFFGVSYGVEHRMHIRMTTFIKLMPKTVQIIAAILMDVIMIAIVSIILPSAWEYFLSRCQVISTTMGVSNGFVMISLPVGYTLLILSLIGDIVKILKGDIPANT